MGADAKSPPGTWLIHMCVTWLIHMCVTWLIHMCVTWLIHMYVTWLIQLCVTWLIHGWDITSHVCDMTLHMCDMTHIYECGCWVATRYMARSLVWHDSSMCVWHDSSRCVTWLIHMCVTWLIHMYVTWLIRMCVTWLIHVWDITNHACDMTLHMCDITHIYECGCSVATRYMARAHVWHDSSIRVTWLTYMRAGQWRLHLCKNSVISTRIIPCANE